MQISRRYFIILSVLALAPVKAFAWTHGVVSTPSYFTDDDGNIFTDDSGNRFTTG